MGRGSAGGSARAKGRGKSKATGGGGGAGGAPGGSGATVRFSPGYSDAEKVALTQKVRQVLGPEAKLQDFAGLAGAPAGSRVTVDIQERVDKTSFRFTVQGEGLQADRSISRDKRGNLILKNEWIEIKATGKGTGTKIFADQVKFATDYGVKAIAAEASSAMGYNGYYTWARLGYNAKLSHSVRDSLPSNLKGARSVAELFKTEAGQTWWRTNGTSTNMRFNLSPGSRAQRDLKRYVDRTKP